MPEPTYQLTARQQQVLHLAAAGYTNPEIGRRVDLTRDMVKKQLSAAIRALGARNRAHAAVIATCRGLIPAVVPAGPALAPQVLDGALRALTDRWTGRAPGALLHELRGITGPRETREAS